MMSKESESYTLFGFSEDLDRRPLLFVEPLPATRVCSACGLVPKTSAFLPCRHVLCKPCYDGCVLSGRVCVLDGEACSETDVQWREFADDKLTNRQVACWNRRNGCDTVTTVSEIFKHFRTHCAYHSARCHKCLATVLQGEMIAHIGAQCNANILSRAVREHADGSVGSPRLGAENVAQEVRVALQKVSEQNASLEARLSQLMVLEEKKGEALSTVQDELSRVTELLNCTLKEVSEYKRKKETQAEELASVKEIIDVFTREIVVAIHDNFGDRT